ncbi:MAG TPA: alpha-hydroxy-acid oxidizing protein [Solirubrobacterales bacterium]|nr:alpha-hydroxy-acid oxidizing protein [Solirubrobacterales bacterium]
MSLDWVSVADAEREGLGRPTLRGLASAGEEGVARVLGLLREELELALALLGCASPSELTRAHVRRAPAATP